MQKVDQVEWTKCNTTPTKICEYTLTHMPQGAEYKFRVMACNAGGAGEPAEIPGVVKVIEMLGKIKYLIMNIIIIYIILSYMYMAVHICFVKTVFCFQHILILSWIKSTRKTMLLDKVVSSGYLCPSRANPYQYASGQRKVVTFLTEL